MAKEKPMAEMPVMKEDEGVFLFYPNVPEEAVQAETKVLHSRWIGQGPRVAEFEKEFTTRFGGEGQSLAVGSGTDALHLAYILAGLQPGDEVITPPLSAGPIRPSRRSRDSARLTVTRVTPRRSASSR